METLRGRLGSWLLELPPGERLEALAIVHDSVRSMNQMVRSVRRDTMVQLIDEQGIGRVSRTLGVSEDRLLHLIAQPVA